MRKTNKTNTLSRKGKVIVEQELPTSDVEMPVPTEPVNDIPAEVPAEEPVDKFAEFSERLKELLASLEIAPEAAETIADAFIEALQSQQASFDDEVASTEAETLEAIEENVKKLNTQWQAKLNESNNSNKAVLKELHEKVKKVISEDYEAYKTELKNKAALMIETKLAKLLQPEAPKAVVEETKVEVPVVNEEAVKLQVANKELKAKVNRLIEEKIALINQLRATEIDSKKLQEEKNTPFRVEVAKPKISNTLNNSNADSLVENRASNSIIGDFERLSGIRRK